MTDSAPPPAFMELEEIAPPRKRRRSPEHRLQAWVDRFIDRAVLPPMFVTGIEIAQSDMARANRRFALAARGVKFGLPDMFVCQAPGRSAWIELKRGARVTDRQDFVHRTLTTAGQNVVVCRSVADVLVALRGFGFSLHGNAEGMAREYDARLDADEPAPKTARAAQRPVAPKQRHAGGGITTAAMLPR